MFWRSGFRVIAAVLEFGCDALLPLSVSTMFPALVDENWIVANPAGAVGVRRVETLRLVVGGVVVAEIIVFVSWAHEEITGPGSQVDHDGRRVGKTTQSKELPLETDRGKQHAAPSDGVIPVTVDKNKAAPRPDVMAGTQIQSGCAAAQ